MIRAGDVANLPGTKIQNRCLVASTGLDAIDQLMGGGLPLSSLYVVSEVNSQKFGPILQKYFVAESLLHGHNLIVGGVLDNNNFLSDVPCSSNGHNVSGNVVEKGEDFKIAWRYQTMPAVASGLSAKDKTKFDLIKKMDVKSGDFVDISVSTYRELYNSIMEELQKPEFALKSGKKLARLILSGIGSPFFEDSENLLPFLAKLKVLLLKTNAIAMIYIDESLFSSTEVNGITSLATAYFKLEPHDENIKKDLALEDSYDGRFHIVKLPTLNSFATNKPDCVDFVFERHRHYFEVKILHLPAVMGGADTKTSCQTASDF